MFYGFLMTTIVDQVDILGIKQYKTRVKEA